MQANYHGQSPPQSVMIKKAGHRNGYFYKLSIMNCDWQGRQNKLQ